MVIVMMGDAKINSTQKKELIDDNTHPRPQNRFSCFFATFFFLGE